MRQPHHAKSEAIAEARTPAASMRRAVRGALMFLAGACATTVAFAALPAGNILGDRTAVATVVPTGAPIAPFPAESAARPAFRLADLLNLKDADLSDADIARLNLAAAAGLPGAEGLDIEAKLAELDRWAKHVSSETERNMHLFRENPAEYENSEAYFRALLLIVVLQGDLGVRYNPSRINEPDFKNSKDLFLHGLVGDTNGGTCVSMPTLYVAVGRHLGYPMKLVVSKGHVFARWDAPDHPDLALRGRFNIEGTNRGLSTFDDKHYAEWPNKLSAKELRSDWYLRSLSSAEELAVFLLQRGHCLEDTGRAHEAQVAYAMAQQLAPKSPDALAYLATAVHGKTTLPPPRGVDSRHIRTSRQTAEAIAKDAVDRRGSDPPRINSHPDPLLRN